jgi:hypothetical protein
MLDGLDSKLSPGYGDDRISIASLTLKRVVPVAHHIIG